jgi:rhodanese-related sulfurtransferase
VTSDPQVHHAVPPEFALDLSCARSVQEISTWLTRPETMLIDLRSPTDYQISHARNAIHLSLSSLLTKPYLRNKTLILMGSGKTEAEIYRNCTRLKQSGYQNVFVMQGGLISWLSAGYALQGKSVSMLDLSQLSTAEFWRETQEAGNLILLEKSRTAFQDILPDSRVLSQNTLGALRSSVDKIRKLQPLTGVILIASPKITDDQVRELLRAAHPLPLLLYTGSEEEYVAHAAQQEAIWSAHAQGPKKLKCGL